MGRRLRCFGSRAGSAVRPDEEATRAARWETAIRQQGMRSMGVPRMNATWNRVSSSSATYECPIHPWRAEHCTRGLVVAWSSTSSISCLLFATSCTKVRDGVDSTNTPNSSHAVNCVKWCNKIFRLNSESLVPPKRGMVNTNVIRAAIAPHVRISKEH